MSFMFNGASGSLTGSVIVSFIVLLFGCIGMHEVPNVGSTTHLTTIPCDMMVFFDINAVSAAANRKGTPYFAAVKNIVEKRRVL